ncbi:MAG: hypothetical protein ISS49_11420 [Anaerolineae bacterium]|nr:hypothetical protein [Anaerolineae bacterium]
MDDLFARPLLGAVRCEYSRQVGAHDARLMERLQVLLDGAPVGTRLLLPPMEAR